MSMQFAGPRAFARHMLSTGFPMVPFLGMRTEPAGHPGGRAMEGVLYRDGQWQIELVVLPPDCQVPRHRHLRFASADLALGGSGLVIVGERVVISPEVHAQQRGRAISNLIRIERGEWHEGSSGSSGGIYLSFQQWYGPPSFIAEDWEACHE